MIPFSPPYIDQKILDEVIDTLKSGWITTGPRTKKLEQKLVDYTGADKVLCVNSATNALELMLRWFGVTKGDEVIVPAYTYCATANVVMHCGAKPVMVDVDKNFNIDINKVKEAITDKTKVIIPVDFSGFPCDYDELFDIVNEKSIQSQFKPNHKNQEQLGRIMILADAAHSVGAKYKNKMSGSLADVSAFSFHAVKNLTTAEGGAICFKFPNTFDIEMIYKDMSASILHGQTKDALAKFNGGSWEYDVVEAGYKCNMPDILAAIGLIELDRYDKFILKRRKEIFDTYSKVFKKESWAETPIYETDTKQSSYHVYPLRIKNIDEAKRNKIIDAIIAKGVSVNVHFKPLPMLSVYKNAGYNIKNYPVAYNNFAREISLPVYVELDDTKVHEVINAVILSVKQIL